MKTGAMTFNHDELMDINTVKGHTLTIVDNFKYLDIWVNNTEKDYEICKAMT